MTEVLDAYVGTLTLLARLPRPRQSPENLDQIDRALSVGNEVLEDVGSFIRFHQHQDRSWSMTVLSLKNLE